MRPRGATTWPLLARRVAVLPVPDAPRRIGVRALRAVGRSDAGGARVLHPQGHRLLAARTCQARARRGVRLARTAQAACVGPNAPRSEQVPARAATGDAVARTWSRGIASVSVAIIPAQLGKRGGLGSAARSAVRYGGSNGDHVRDGWTRSFRETVLESRVGLLSFDAKHAEELREIPSIHRDPFGRMLVAQARVDRLVLLPVDERIECAREGPLRREALRPDTFARWGCSR